MGASKRVWAARGYGDINIDLAAVPVPAAFWLFGTALIDFVGMSRRIKVG
jgi:hypothetical protein